MRRCPRPGIRSTACATALCAAACSVFDTSGVGTSAGTGSSGDSTADDAGSDTVGDAGHGEEGSAGCGAPNRCGAPVPVGWSGPFAVASTTAIAPPLECPLGWTEATRASSGLTAESATCGCDCVRDVGSCSIAVAYFSDAVCVNAVEEVRSEGSCDVLSVQEPHGYARALAAADGVACTPSASMVVPPFEWTDQTLLCSPPAGLPCEDGGACLPEAPTDFAGRWCIATEGDDVCPVGEYPQRFVVYGDTVDTRDCTSCLCSVASVPICAGELIEFLDTFCAFETGSFPIDGECHSSAIEADTSWSVSYDGTPPAYECAGEGAMPQGAVTPTDPITLCCEA